MRPHTKSTYQEGISKKHKHLVGTHIAGIRVDGSQRLMIYRLVQLEISCMISISKGQPDI